MGLFHKIVTPSFLPDTMPFRWGKCSSLRGEQPVHLLELLPTLPVSVWVQIFQDVVSSLNLCLTVMISWLKGNSLSNTKANFANNID